MPDLKKDRISAGTFDASASDPTRTLGQGADSAAPEGLLDMGDRYTDLGLIGRGGMGEVRRVKDAMLDRTVAMKILTIQGSNSARERFLEEARITAQLEHPVIVPVHDTGLLPDTRPYFTMKVIEGRTLTAIIEESHRGGLASADEESRTDAEGKWPLRRLIGALQLICEGVGYAHTHGVLHRDLKPGNLMAGAFGEVLVLDWGLTRVYAAAAGTVKVPIVSRSESQELRTQFGAIIGTPRYMSPEQASGDSNRITARSDVYSLGAVLYTMLDGRAPYAGETGKLPVLDGPPVELGHRSSGSAGMAIPVELKAICEIAMARDPARRYADGRELARALSAWLEGSLVRERAARILRDARNLRPRAAKLRADAAQLEAKAAGMLMGIPPFAPYADKRPALELQDRAATLQSQARLTDIRYTQLIRGALVHVADLAPANSMLAEYYQERHAVAEATRDRQAAEEFEVLLRDHDDGTFADYLKGDGFLTLRSEPAGATATLYRYVEEDRRLIPKLVEDLGPTPVEEYRLPMGSYLVKLSCRGRADVLYPVFIERQQHWDGHPPGGFEPQPVYLPKARQMGQDECYVPAGWFWGGGDAKARNSLPAQRLWLDGFAMQRFNVTVAEYVEFLNDLVKQGREEESLLHAPPLPAWEEGKVSEDQRELGVVRGPDGVFRLDGPVEKVRWPATMINWFAAVAYAEWFAAKTGQPWRLITDMEHEKAARGVDGRFYPWGNYLDPTFCCMRMSHTGQGRALKALVDEFPVDESPYGARGLAGNVFSWCQDPLVLTGPDVVEGVPRVPDPAKVRGPGAGGVHRVVRGGNWRDGEEYCRAAFRDGPPAVYRDTCLGFRLVRSLG
jgi:serine/threonine-protein kinase